MKSDNRRKGYCGSVFVSRTILNREHVSRLHPAVDAPGLLRPLYRVNVYEKPRQYIP